MNDVSRNHPIAKLEAILARDLIDLANDYATDKHVIEVVSNLCFTMVRLFDELGRPKTAIDWQKLFDAYDRKYYAMKQGRQYKSNAETQRVHATATAIIDLARKTE